MSQAVLSPNLTKKFQRDVSQIADKERSPRSAIRWFKCKLKPPKNGKKRNTKRYSCRNINIIEIILIQKKTTLRSSSYKNKDVHERHLMLIMIALMKKILCTARFLLLNKSVLANNKKFLFLYEADLMMKYNLVFFSK